MEQTPTRPAAPPTAHAPQTPRAPEEPGTESAPAVPWHEEGSHQSSAGGQWVGGCGFSLLYWAVSGTSGVGVALTGVGVVLLGVM